MKIRPTLFGLVLFGLLSCSDEEFDLNEFHDDATITTLNGSWRVISFEDFILNKQEIKTQENSWGFDIIVFFNDTLEPNLFGGKVTTNSVSGEFEYVDTRQFKLQYGSTFLGQPEWADKFGDAVHGEAVTFKINSKRLRIYYDNGTKSMTLRKE